MGLKIAVLMGGASFERDFSLASGKRVCEALAAAGHKVVPLDTTGQLVPTLRSERPDAVYSALHGKHGEDGTIQSLLELLGIPATSPRWRAALPAIVRLRAKPRQPWFPKESAFPAMRSRIWAPLRRSIWWHAAPADRSRWRSNPLAAVRQWASTGSIRRMAWAWPFWMR